MIKLLSKFKVKCLMFLLVIKKRNEDDVHSLGIHTDSDNNDMIGQTKEASLEHNNHADMMNKIATLFSRVNDLYEKGNDVSGLNVCFRLIIETSLVELVNLGNITNASGIIFRFFIVTKFLEKTEKQIQMCIKLFRTKLSEVAENSEFLFDKDHFVNSVTTVIDNVAEIYFTQF